MNLTKDVGKLVCGQISNPQSEWTKVDKCHHLVVAESGQVPRKGKEKIAVAVNRFLPAPLPLPLVLPFS